MRDELPVDTLATGFLVVDSERVVRARNRKLESIWRFPEPVQLGQREKPVLHFVSQQLVDSQTFLRQVEEVYADPQRESFDLLRLKDGRVVEQYSAPHRISGSAARVWSFHDLTPGLERARQVGASGKLESVARLATGIAHDFNHLFTIIQDFTDLLLARSRVSAEEVKALQQIGQAADRAAELTQQLQTFGRTNQLHARQRDLNDVALRILNKLQPSIPPNVELLYEPATDLPAASFDPKMIEQALSNLFANALDALTPDGGQLRIRTRVVQVDAKHVLSRPEARTGRFVCVAVSDTGCGMDAATAQRVFDPFFTTRGNEGRPGLGLSKVYGIVKLHRGWVEASSQLGLGSTFTMFLPVSSEAGTEEAGSGMHGALQ